MPLMAFKTARCANIKAEFVIHAHDLAYSLVRDLLQDVGRVGWDWDVAAIALSTLLPQRNDVVAGCLSCCG